MANPYTRLRAYQRQQYLDRIEYDAWAALRRELREMPTDKLRERFEAARSKFFNTHPRFRHVRSRLTHITAIIAEELALRERNGQ